MQVCVCDRLTGRRTDIDPQVVAIGIKFVVEQRLGLFDERPNRFEFVGPRRKKIRFMAPRNYKEMPGRNRKFIEARIGQHVFQHGAVSLAERTGPRSVHRPTSLASSPENRGHAGEGHQYGTAYMRNDRRDGP